MFKRETVSLILPAYNEASSIEKAVFVTAEILSKITDHFEIIIAEDGSKDGTDQIVLDLSKKYHYVFHLHSDERQGRGRALNRAFKAASGEILCYIDVDLATDMIHLKELLHSISVEGYDISTGSRMIPGNDAKRSLKRGVASNGFNFLVRTILSSKIYDHQCGFKAFKREPLFNLLSEIQDKGWFWDTELLVLAQHHGYKVKEFPVTWREGNTTKVDLKKDIFDMGFQIFRLQWTLNKQLKMNGGKPREVVAESREI
jgi:glycosyltransferase involved in cell wall biosynthesis